MLDLANQSIPGCKDDQGFDEYQSEGVIGCGSAWAYPYFITYIILVVLIVLNLLLAVVVEGFAESKKENDAVINPSQIDEFLDKWAEYDPKGTGLITPEEFLFILHDLFPPIGLKEETVLKYSYELDCKPLYLHLLVTIIPM